MSDDLIVRGAPQELEVKENAWQELPKQLKLCNLKNVLILHGKKSWNAVHTYFPELLNIQKKFYYYGGEVTDAAAESFTHLIHQKHFDAVIAVGGGKVADLGKYVAYKAHVPIIILPTLAATCAAYTPLSVIYRADGVMERFDIFPKANDLVLLDPAIILQSPQDLMVAGIGDTLAKWYEAAPVINQLNVQPIEVQVAAFAAKKCQENLLTKAQAALQAMETQTLNQAFIDVVETNILLAGMVGGFGDEYGRTSGAHSIHDALTKIPASHTQLHGNKVAYGILVQLLIENKAAEVEKLLPFYQALGLPKNLTDLQLTLTEAEYQTVAKAAAAPTEAIHLLPVAITPEKIVTAMHALEQLTV